MSQAIFPVLPGLTFDIVKQPRFSTKIQTAVSGKEYRAAFYNYPLYTFSFAYDLLRDTAAFQELQKVMGFFNARKGCFDNFLFDDTTDDTAATQSFGTGDGVTANFQLARTYGNGSFNASDLVQNYNVITSVFNNASNIAPGAGAGKYTVSNTGMVTFGTAPAANATITWNGTFYYRCRFVSDTLDFNLFMASMWDLKKLDFIGSPQNKV